MQWDCTNPQAEGLYPATDTIIFTVAASSEHEKTQCLESLCIDVQHW